MTHRQSHPIEHASIRVESAVDALNRRFATREEFIENMNSYLTASACEFEEYIDINGREQAIQLATPGPAKLPDNRWPHKQFEAKTEFPFHVPIQKDCRGIYQHAAIRDQLAR